MLDSELKNIRVEEANLWSYVALQSIQIMKLKGSGNGYEEEKKQLIEALVRASKSIFASSQDNIMKMLNEIEEGLLKVGYKVKVVEAELESRGAFGLSADFGVATFELGLSFDPILNVPFIPGSSLKGAVRAAYTELLQSKKELDRDAAEREAERLFGGSSEQAGAGLIGFTDAYPIVTGKGGYLLYPDVLTPHYKDADIELDAQPSPHVFLTIAPGTRFRFYVFWVENRGGCTLRVKGEDTDLMEGYLIADKPSMGSSRVHLGWVDLAVLYALGLGVGGKTRLGYSTLRIVRYEPLRGEANAQS